MNKSSDILLIKVGGGKQIDWDSIAENVRSLVAANHKVILIHGAGAIRDTIAARLNAPTRIVQSPSGISSVYTDEAALEIFLMVYAGLVNKKIVAKLQSYGINAVGLSGVDGRIWQGRRKAELFSIEDNKTKLLRNNFTGKVESTNTSLLELLLKENYIPVLCPPAISEQHEIINVDNDRATAVLAKALGVQQILVLFEAPGLLENVHDSASVIRRIKKEELQNYFVYAQGRMKMKLMGAREALESGVKRVHWGDGRVKNPIFRLLEGEGTLIA